MNGQSLWKILIELVLIAIFGVAIYKLSKPTGHGKGE
jgi:hypothetical protein